MYSIKSGYNFLTKENLEPCQNVSNPSLHDSFWKAIWLAKIPNKVQNFQWRACRNAIPSKTNLVQQSVLSKDNCELCCSSPELTLHALWECYGLTNIWETNLHWLFRRSRVFSSFFKLVQFVLVEELDLELFAVC